MCRLALIPQPLSPAVSDSMGEGEQVPSPRGEGAREAGG